MYLPVGAEIVNITLEDVLEPDVKEVWLPEPARSMTHGSNNNQCHIVESNYCPAPKVLTSAMRCLQGQNNYNAYHFPFSVCHSQLPSLHEKEPVTLRRKCNTCSS